MSQPWKVTEGNSLEERGFKKFIKSEDKIENPHGELKSRKTNPQSPVTARRCGSRLMGLDSCLTVVGDDFSRRENPGRA
jgi:hypothetical protein